MTRRIGADVLVIGSGPAGAAVARVFADAGLATTMIDGGSQLGPVPGKHLRNSRHFAANPGLFADLIKSRLVALSVDDRSVGFAGGRLNPDQTPELNLGTVGAVEAVGGMATLWTAVCPRQHPTLERTSLIDDVRWDWSYERAESFLGVRTDQFTSAMSDRLLDRLQAYYDGRPMDSIGRPDQPVQRLPVAAKPGPDGSGPVRWTGVDTVLALDETQARPIAIEAEITVNELVHRSGRVISAKGHSWIDNDTVILHADHFVVAGGAVRTPQLLWASGIRPDALGHYLNEHIVASTTVELDRDLVEENGAYIEPHLWVPLGPERPWHTQIHNSSINQTSIEGRPYSSSDGSVLLQAFGMMEARASNRVFFSSRHCDDRGMPQPTFEVERSETDLRKAEEMRRELDSLAGVLRGYPMEGAATFEHPGSSLHLMSTTRMGHSDDGGSVTDSLCRVWGFENLQVAGAGTIPCPSAANPTLTAVALAIHSADGVLGALDTPKVPDERRLAETEKRVARPASDH